MPGAFPPLGRHDLSEELDINGSETLYDWQEQPWTEKDLLLELGQEDGTIRQQKERQAQRLVAQDGATEKAAPLNQTRMEQTGSLEWRWTDGRGVANGCRIEGPRLAVWTEGPFGGTGTDYSVSEFLDGRHETVLPPAVSAQVRRALTTRQEE